MRYNFATLSACLFAIGGLIIPLHSEAEGASPFNFGKNFKHAGTTSSDCAGEIGALQSDGDCKSDSKSSKTDLDRKGHKVKKSKSRGR